jgi:hypothetical protein
MKVCSLCGKKIQTDNYFSRKTTCPACGGDLHICMNCKFYSESSHNKCIETKAEFQRTRDKSNFCDYFVFRESSSASAANEKVDAKKRLDDLFRTP